MSATDIKDRPKPRIAISGAQIQQDTGVAGSKSVQAMVALVRRCGGDPVIIDYLKPEPASNFDGIVLMGNDYDIDPKRYDPKAKVHKKTQVETDNNALPKRTHEQVALAKKRANYEWQAIREAEANNIPLFGVCGGMQRINVALGGQLVQHLDGLNASEGNSEVDRGAPVKTISLVHDTHLMHMSERANLLDLDNLDEDGNPLGINSFHHQVIRPSHYGRGLRVAAVAQERHADGTGRMVIEALEAENPSWYIMGVQWHPEFMPESKLSQAMLSRFIEHSADRQVSKPDLASAVQRVSRPAAEAALTV